MNNLVNESGDLVNDLVNDTISRQAAIRWVKTECNPYGKPTLDFDSGKKVIEHLEQMPSAQPERKNGRVFKGIVVEYLSYNTYPEYEGKPYFSIKYTENGQELIGYGTYKPEVLSEYLKEYFMPSTQPGWIPCSERLPDAEKTVLVTVEVRPKGFMHYKKVVKAFYESGKVTEDDSEYTWYNCDNLVENENGEYVVPEGWWEDVDYAEEFTAIDDFVTAWMPLPTPYREGGQDEQN